MEIRQRVEAPGGEEPEDQAAQEPLSSHHSRGGRGRQVECRGRREEPGDDEADRCRDDEAGVLVREEHSRRRERVESEEPRARDEPERDEEQACIVETAGGLSGEIAEHDADQRGHEDEPEVRRVVLPVDVRHRL